MRAAVSSLGSAGTTITRSGPRRANWLNKPQRTRGSAALERCPRKAKVTRSNRVGCASAKTLILLAFLPSANSSKLLERTSPSQPRSESGRRPDRRCLHPGYAFGKICIPRNSAGSIYSSWDQPPERNIWQLTDEVDICLDPFPHAGASPPGRACTWACQSWRSRQRNGQQSGRRHYVGDQDGRLGCRR
jgi:hypothetical protein